MPAACNDKGRAYEYIWMETLYNAIHNVRPSIVIDNSSLHANESAWNKQTESMKKIFQDSADAALETILELEPRIFENSEDKLSLEFQQDGAGKEGDVRDIVIKRNGISWEVGLSIKHNHEAIKHSRLSKDIDFGKEWFDTPCTRDYWNDIHPIFDELKKLKNRGVYWRDLPDKEGSVYRPLLIAFMDEVKRAYKINPNMPRKMIEYLIGIKDYYKVVSVDKNRLTMIHTFNAHNTLNKPGTVKKCGKVKVSAITVPVLKLPTELKLIDFKSNKNTTIEMYFDNGWQLSFRIHNASEIVETSLKFDIQFIGMPISILNIRCIWNRSGIGTVLN